MENKHVLSHQSVIYLYTNYRRSYNYIIYNYNILQLQTYTTVNQQKYTKMW